MSVKILLTWNIKANAEQEYYGFMVGSFLPWINHKELALTDAWVTLYGNEPQIMVGVIMPTYTAARELLKSAEWLDLRDQLLEFVENFTCKIISQKGAFQL
ncbi:MAG: hypothetical protein ABFD21_01385 [Anaerolineaceae bacterium]